MGFISVSHGRKRGHIECESRARRTRIRHTQLAGGIRYLAGIYWQDKMQWSRVECVARMRLPRLRSGVKHFECVCALRVRIEGECRYHLCQHVMTALGLQPELERLREKR